MYLVEIRSITKLPGNIEDLIHESEKEGFTFISRLKTEWEKAENRFDDIGEFLLSASCADHTLGAGRSAIADTLVCQY